MRFCAFALLRFCAFAVTQKYPTVSGRPGEPLQLNLFHNCMVLEYKYGMELRSFVRPLRRVAPVEPAGTRPKGSVPTVHAAPIQTDRSAACLPAGPSSFKRAGKSVKPQTSDVQCVCNNTENVAKSCNYAGHETRVNNGMFYKVLHADST